MKTILLLRHGKSSWKDDRLADHDRPLKKRGKMDAKKIGKLIEEQDLVPDVIYCSTAKRARDTVGFLLENLQYDEEVIFTRNLYHGYTYDRVTIEGKLRVENLKREAIRLEVTKTLSGELASSAPAADVKKLARGLRKMNPTSVLTWQADVDPDEELLVDYTYTVLVRRCISEPTAALVCPRG